MKKPPGIKRKLYKVFVIENDMEVELPGWVIAKNKEAAKEKFTNEHPEYKEFKLKQRH
jgi:hypothetical protein